MKRIITGPVFAAGLWLLGALGVEAQTLRISTFAGSPTPDGLGFADGTGARAQFNLPLGIVMDHQGNFYVADTGNHTIRKITAAAVVTTIAGQPGIPGADDGLGTNALFSGPQRIAVDNANNLYVSDGNNNTIRKITPQGRVSTLAGAALIQGSADGVSTNALFWGPTGIAVDSSGTVYVADTMNHTIRKISPAGVVTTFAGQALTPGLDDGVGTNAFFTNPQGLALDTNGNLYVAGANTIRKITPAGRVTTLAGYPSNAGSVDGVGTNAMFHGPSGLAVDGTGNVYVADMLNSQIRRVTPTGVVTTLAGVSGLVGSTDGTTNALFFQPVEVVVDAGLNLYLTDSGNHDIRKGTFLPATPPRLRASRSANGIVLSWPSAYSDYLVETSPRLATHAAWSPLTNGVAATTNGFSLTNAISAKAAFYRLRVR